MIKKILVIPFFPILLALIVAIAPSILVGPIHESSALTGTTTALHASANPSVSGQKVTFAAIVTPSNATGTVTFAIDGVTQPAVTLTSGHATISTNTLSVGTHQIIAQYSGDTNFASS